MLTYKNDLPREALALSTAEEFMESRVAGMNSTRYRVFIFCGGRRKHGNSSYRDGIVGHLRGVCR